MIDRDKIMKGLECCKNWKCHSYECPYYTKGLHCYQALREDVIRILEGKGEKEDEMPQVLQGR